MYLDVQKFDEAISDFSRAHELDPKDAWALANRGLAWAWEKNQPKAEADFALVRSIDPSNPVMLRGEALLRRNVGDDAGAVDFLTASMKRDPDNIWALQARRTILAIGRAGEIRRGRSPLQAIDAGSARQATPELTSLGNT